MLRALRNVTQEQLAEMVNKTRALISYVESTGKCNFYTLQAILKALDISMEDFGGFTGEVLVAKEKSMASEYGKGANRPEKQIENLRKEIEMLHEIILSQKKIISMLESAKGKKRKK